MGVLGWAMAGGAVLFLIAIVVIRAKRSGSNQPGQDTAKLGRL